jgi:acetyl/propionyl-CoA carboxylase alpha subunit
MAPVMALEIALGDGRAHEVEVARHGTRATITIDGRDYAASLGSTGDAYELVFETRSERMWLAVSGDTVWVHAFGRAWALSLTDPVERPAGATSSEDLAAAPMPGTVITVAVEPGQQVRKGEQLVVIESMKMQSEIIALRDGVVETVFLAVGDTFDRGAALVALAPLGPGTPAQDGA